MRHESTLPLGTRPLAEVRQEPDPLNRVQQAATLLEFTLRRVDPKPTGADGKPIMLGERVKRNEKRFADVGGVFFALGVRNDISHGLERGKSRDDHDVERAGQLLIGAVEQLLPSIPHAVHQAITGSEERPRTRTTSNRPLVLGTCAVVILLGSWFLTGGELSRFPEAMSDVSAALHRDEARDALVKIDRLVGRLAGVSGEHGIQKLKDELETLHTEMRRNINEGSFRKGLDAVPEIEALSARVEARSAARDAAWNSLQAADSERASAEAVQALELTAPSWQLGEDARAEAGEALAHGDFEEANDLAEKARQEFALAVEQAKQAKLAAQRRSTWDQLVVEIGRERLDNYGGAAWKDALTHTEIAATRTVEMNHEDAASSYANALEALRKIVSPVLLGAVADEVSPTASLNILRTLLRLEPEDARAQEAFDEFAQTELAWWVVEASRELQGDETGERAVASVAWACLALVRNEVDGPEGYDAAMDQAISTARRVESSEELASLSGELAWCCLLVGDLERGKQLAQSIERVLVNLPAGEPRSWGHAELAALYYALGEDSGWEHHRGKVAADTRHGDIAEVNALGEIGDLKHAEERARQCGNRQAAALARVALYAALYGDDDVYTECRRSCLDAIDRHAPTRSMAICALAQADAVRGFGEEAWRTLEPVSQDAYRSPAFATLAVAHARRGEYEKARRAIGKLESERLQVSTLFHASRALAAHGGTHPSELWQWSEEQLAGSGRAAILVGAALGLALANTEVEASTEWMDELRPRLVERRNARRAETDAVFERLMSWSELDKTYIGRTKFGIYETRIELKFTHFDATRNTVRGISAWQRTDGARDVHGFVAEAHEGRLFVRENEHLAAGGWPHLTYDLGLAEDRKALEGTWSGSGIANEAMSIELE